MQMLKPVSIQSFAMNLPAVSPSQAGRSTQWDLAPKSSFCIQLKISPCSVSVLPQSQPWHTLHGFPRDLLVSPGLARVWHHHVIALTCPSMEAPCRWPPGALWKGHLEMGDCRAAFILPSSFSPSHAEVLLQTPRGLGHSPSALMFNSSRSSLATCFPFPLLKVLD